MSGTGAHVEYKQNILLCYVHFSIVLLLLLLPLTTTLLQLLLLLLLLLLLPLLLYYNNLTATTTTTAAAASSSSTTYILHTSKIVILFQDLCHTERSFLHSHHVCRTTKNYAIIPTKTCFTIPLATCCKTK